MQLNAANGSDQTVQSRVYSALRLAILDGDFVPGKPMTIRGVAEELGVSATPVREALRRLTAERALHLSATGRVSVPLMTREKLAELVVARICLEKQAAVDALPGVTDATVRKLGRLNLAIDEAIAVGNHQGYLATHRDFHFSLYRCAGGEVMLPLIESVWLQISPFMHFTLGIEHLSRYNSNDRHLEIIEALGRRDATALAFAVEADIRQGIGALDESDWKLLQQDGTGEG